MFRYLVSSLFVLAVVLAAGSYFFLSFWEHRHDELIARHARVYRLDERLVWSLIYEETWFRAGAIGEDAEIGLMQVTPLVAREWAKETGLREFERETTENVVAFMSDPERSIQVGCWYLEKIREALQYRSRFFLADDRHARVSGPQLMLRPACSRPTIHSNVPASQIFRGAA